MYLLEFEGVEIVRKGIVRGVLEVCKLLTPEKFGTSDAPYQTASGLRFW